MDNRKKISSYAINLMWINDKKYLSSEYIYQDKSKEETIQKILMPAIKWKKANPQAKVTLWYDSERTNKNAVSNTEKLLQELMQQENMDPACKIQLRDVREIPFVKFNPDVFSVHFPLYFLVDLLKLVICLYCIETDLNEVAIFSDQEVGDLRKDKDRMNYDELFKQSVMNILADIGVLLNENIGNIGGLYVENQFIQVLNKPETLDAIKHMINASIYRAIYAIQVKDNEKRPYYMLGLLESVYQATTEDLISYVFQSQNNEGVLIKTSLLGSEGKDQWIKYDPNQHGYAALGTNRSARDNAFSIILNERNIYARRNEFINLPDEVTQELNTYTRARDDVAVRKGRQHYYTMAEYNIVPLVEETSKYKEIYWDEANKLEASVQDQRSKINFGLFKSDISNTKQSHIVVASSCNIMKS